VHIRAFLGAVCGSNLCFMLLNLVCFGGPSFAIRNGLGTFMGRKLDLMGHSLGPIYLYRFKAVILWYLKWGL
jgi:hypothetical protein